jgi:tetratricopeptide (TPR) repeat protein
VPAQLALAELAYDQGDREAAQRAVNAALLADPEQLRARLLRLFLSADDADPASVRRDLARLDPAMKKAGNIDRALSALVRARLLRRQGDSEGAAKAVTDAGNAGGDEPRLLAWVAREALALGKLPLAQNLASQALSAAPDVAQHRRLLARILIDRNDGEHALQLLEKLPADDLDAQIMKAQAALIASDPAALKAALEGLAQMPASKRELATTTGALRVRIEARLTPGKAVVDRARALVRSAPGDAAALLALAEAALAAHDPHTAQNALKQRFAVAPDDPNAHVLLGRARRMALDAAGAEASFRRALELAPGSSDAMIALAELLLDEGKYADADSVYQELATRGGSTVLGRLGRVDALAGLGRTADAEVQLAAIPEAQADTAAVRVSAARLALARGKAGDALTMLRPLADDNPSNVQIVALYGDALLAAQQLEAADKAYAAALALDSELPEAVLGHAEILLRQGKAKEALPILQKANDVIAQRIRPPALQARRLMLLGRALFARNKRGDAERGRDALREATKIPGAPPDSFYFLAESLGGKNNPEARAAYQRYLELEPGGQYRDRARRAVASSK